MIFDSSIGYDTEPSLVFPTSRNQLSEEEEAEQYIIDTLQSQKEFEGMNLNQVTIYIVGLSSIHFTLFNVVLALIISYHLLFSR